jgi:hypothetical protein
LRAEAPFAAVFGFFTAVFFFVVFFAEVVAFLGVGFLAIPRSSRKFIVRQLATGEWSNRITYLVPGDYLSFLQYSHNIVKNQSFLAKEIKIF